MGGKAAEKIPHVKQERIMPMARDEEGNLRIEEVSLKELAEKHGTPIYVMSQQRIEQNYERLSKAFTESFGTRGMTVVLNYACKANTNLAVLTLLRKKGCNIDAVSVNEVKTCLLAGYRKESISFTGTSNTPEVLNWLIENKVQVNFDSPDDLEKVNTLPGIVSFRVNPNVGAGHHEHCITGGKGVKFGVYEDQIVEAYLEAKKKGATKFGIHCHIGSGILEVEPFVMAVQKMLEIVKLLQAKAGITMDYIDFGGGFGVPYKRDAQELNLEKLADKLAATVEQGLKALGYVTMPEIHFEPGRYLACDATVLLTRVTTIKKVGEEMFAGIDSGFNHLIRPAFYGSFHDMAVDGKEKETEEYSVYGPLCESGDVFARKRKMPVLEKGDLVAILNAGAYGYTMASNYNMLPRPKEIMVKGNKHEVVRHEDSFDEMLKNSSVPDWI